MRLRFAVACLWLACAACSTGPSATLSDAGPPGGPVAGPADDHCAGDGAPFTQAISIASCSADPHTVDAGATQPYGAPMYGASGADDDCKYDVSWSATQITENADVTFTLTAKKRADGSPATGAAPYVDATLSPTHPAPNALPTTTETAPGVYTMGPERFDKAGRWTVRFHLYGACTDALVDSPHAHAAFFVDVP